MASAFGLRRFSNSANTLGGVVAVLQKFGEFDGVFESAVHALAVERHDRVRRVADEQCASADVPAIEIQRAEHAGRIDDEVFAQFGNQRQRVGEVAREERLLRRRRWRWSRSSDCLRWAGTA